MVYAHGRAAAGATAGTDYRAKHGKFLANPIGRKIGPAGANTESQVAMRFVWRRGAPAPASDSCNLPDRKRSATMGGAGGPGGGKNGETGRARRRKPNCDYGYRSAEFLWRYYIVISTTVVAVLSRSAARVVFFRLGCVIFPSCVFTHAEHNRVPK